MDDNELELFTKAVKLVLLLQATLEQMDELKGTPIYKKEIKRDMNNLESRIEAHIKPVIKQMAKDEEFIMMQIARGIDSILDKTIMDIHNG